MSSPWAQERTLAERKGELKAHDNLLIKRW